MLAKTLTELHSSQFVRVFSNMPIEDRKKPVIKIRNIELNWIDAYNHVIDKTEVAEKIIGLLLKRGLLYAK